MNVFITGISSGLGQSLAAAYLSQGDTVFGLSRRPPTMDFPSEDWSFAAVDLADFEGAKAGTQELLGGVNQLDLIWLNAGVLGELKDMADATIKEMQHTFDVNVWANKVVLDTVFAMGIDVKQVVAMSSGAAVNGNRGWNGYSIAKAALNMLIQLYAAERPGTHFCALAPGLVDTAMQDYICALPPSESRPSVEKLKAARGTEYMPGPDGAVSRILSHMPKIIKLPSGSFADIRLFSE